MNQNAKYEKVPKIENNFCVKLRTYSHLSRLSPHWHEHTELLFFLDGKCDFICGGKAFSVNAGDLVVVNSAEVHSFVSKDTPEYICVIIYPEFFSDVEFLNVQLENIIRGDKHIESLFLQMQKEYAGQAPGYDMMIKGCAYSLMTYLLRTYSTVQLSKRELEKHNTSLERLNLIMEYISSHYHEKITSAMLADMLYINENHFCRFFKGAVGKTPIEYLNEFRIEKATVFLAKTDDSIATVAKNCGFDDINYFSRTFKRINGISPTEYRRKA